MTGQPSGPPCVIGGRPWNTIGHVNRPSPPPTAVAMGPSLPVSTAAPPMSRACWASSARRRGSAGSAACSAGGGWYGGGEAAGGALAPACEPDVAEPSPAPAPPGGAGAG